MQKFVRTVAIVFLLFAFMPVGSAHGEIVGSFPAQYSNTTPIPTQVWIDFDGNLQTLEGQSINTIEVIDSTGLAVNSGESVIAGNRVSTNLSGQSAPGVFTVNYRVVSQDGHPVEGSYTFNASPNYAEADTQKSTTIAESKVSTGTIVLGAVLVLTLVALVIKLRK